MTVEWMTLLTSWSFRPLAILLAGVAVWLYARGGQTNPVEAGQRRKFRLSIFVFLFALISPIDFLARHFFFLHVAQHLLLISLFPSLFMAADSLPVLFAGLPTAWQKPLQSLLQRWEPAFTHLTPKGACWFLFVATVWLWYDPSLHALTLTSPFFYNLAIVTMMTGAMLHWWHVTAAAPRLHPRLPGFTHMGYTFIGAAPLKIPGIVFLFAYLPFYGYEAGTFLGFPLDPLLSQQLGGIVVWSLGGVVYSTTAVSFLSNWLSIEAEKPEQPRTIWDNDETLMAPHLKN